MWKSCYDVNYIKHVKPYTNPVMDGRSGYMTCNKSCPARQQSSPVSVCVCMYQCVYIYFQHTKNK